MIENKVYNTVKVEFLGVNCGKLRYYLYGMQPFWFDDFTWHIEIVCLTDFISPKYLGEYYAPIRITCDNAVCYPNRRQKKMLPEKVKFCVESKKRPVLVFDRSILPSEVAQVRLANLIWSKEKTSLGFEDTQGLENALRAIIAGKFVDDYGFLYRA